MKYRKNLMRRACAAALLALAAGSGLEAQVAESLNGETIEAGLVNFADNLRMLVPDMMTQQNVWAAAPTRDKSLGFGLTVNGTVFALNKIDNAVKSYDRFSDNSGSLQAFPEGLPFGPGGVGEMRFGIGNSIDIGLAGMYFPLSVVLDMGDSDYTFWTVGMDARWDMVSVFPSRLQTSKRMPRLTVIGGYYLSGMRMDLTLEKGQTAWFDLRSDTLYGALQATGEVDVGLLAILRPYGGIRVTGSATNRQYGYSSGTMAVRFPSTGDSYESGLTYVSEVDHGDTYLNFQVYGGMSLSLLRIPELVTVGVMYNLLSEHIGVSVSARLRFGGGSWFTTTPSYGGYYGGGYGGYW